ncbi:sulfatase-like hydrolase/transferase [Cognatishimia sp. SS12]|uniref:sulfatase-like hydrolase/transferase n=1 Tax=Cognatishimia sp. SS12 TaxID=2979465 RepID=UPI00232FECD3|nr:sulfatase-like hydrolase/transferase [Cognatishimia sp. SS12]MDC0738306.1 sulfatase-like hydrolase/transferase [Cognatishimia sp. SS12]
MTEYTPKNLVVIMADEHNRQSLGCYGHPFVETPNLDRLAQSGTRFTAAYTPSPICVPARASFATGKPVHEIRKWDNAHPFDGTQDNWHRRLRDAGHHVQSIGKLHFRGGEDEDNGFTESTIPMNVVDGMGDVLGLIRDRSVVRGAADKMARLAGPGESAYTAYDREISSRAQTWLRQNAQDHADKPWVLFVSFVSPHFPLTAPAEYFHRYAHRPMPRPKLYGDSERPDHPYLRDYAETFEYDAHFETDADVRRGQAGYLGLCSFIDDQVGHIMTAIEAAGLQDETRIVYTSDHGDNQGARGLWGKSTMYEESVGVPLIVSGPDIPRAKVHDAPRSLIDLSRFILQSTGCDADGFGEVDLLSENDAEVISEYHATGSKSACYMLRWGQWKYVHYALYEPQLFDLKNDPEELTDLAQDPAYQDILNDSRARLEKHLNPDVTHQQAMEDQQALITKYGGVEAIMARGDFGFSPPPGVQANFAVSDKIKT